MPPSFVFGRSEIRRQATLHDLAAEQGSTGGTRQGGQRGVGLLIGGGARCLASCSSVPRHSSDGLWCRWHVLASVGWFVT